MVSLLVGEVSLLGKSSKRGELAEVRVLFVGLVSSRVDLALTVGHGLDDEGGGEKGIVTRKSGLDLGVDQSFKHHPGPVASCGDGRS